MNERRAEGLELGAEGRYTMTKIEIQQHKWEVGYGKIQVPTS